MGIQTEQHFAHAPQRCGQHVGAGGGEEGGGQFALSTVADLADLGRVALAFILQPFRDFRGQGGGGRSGQQRPTEDADGSAAAGRVTLFGFGVDLAEIPAIEAIVHLEIEFPIAPQGDPGLRPTGPADRRHILPLADRCRT